MMSSEDECELLALIAHELRSPAAVVAGYLRLLRKEDVWANPDRARQMIEETDRSSTRVLQLVKELADMADLVGREPGSSAPVAVFALCEEVVQAAAGGGGPATFSCPSEDKGAQVFGDAGHLRRAFTALLAVVRRERGNDPTEVYGFVNRGIDKDHGGPSAVIALGDLGIAQRRDRLADAGVPFDRWRGGTGLSVPIAYRIVEASGGRLWSLPEESRAACALSLPVS